MSIDVPTGPVLASAAAAAVLIGSASIARAFDRLERWLEGSQERLVVFPTYARLHDDGDLTVPVHAWVYEPEHDSSTRNFVVDSLTSWLEIEREDQQERFERRIRPFLVDNERGQRVDMKLAGESYRVGTTAPDGHTSKRIRVPREVAAKALHVDGDSRWLEPTFVTEFGSIERAVPLIERRGLSVVSDVDDTIKVTEVLDRRAMLRNTFLREFEAVDGMADLYRRLAGEHAPAFHYLSASPWQLLPFLQDFRRMSNFPAGLFHLRSLRVKSISSPIDFVNGSSDYKRSTLRRLLEDFPRRDFLFIGDSGEHDPEVYGHVAREHPEQIRRIWIREVDGAKNAASRFEAAFEGLDDSKWTTFTDPSALRIPDGPTDDSEESD